MIAKLTAALRRNALIVTTLVFIVVVLALTNVDDEIVMPLAVYVLLLGLGIGVIACQGWATRKLRQTLQERNETLLVATTRCVEMQSVMATQSRAMAAMGHALTQAQDVLRLHAHPDAAESYAVAEAERRALQDQLVAALHTECVGNHCLLDRTEECSHVAH